MDKKAAIRLEALQLLGVTGQADERLLREVDGCIGDIDQISGLEPISRRVRLSHGKNGIVVAGTALVLKGKSIKRFLEDAPEAILVAATLGRAVERRLQVLQHTDLKLAVLFDAVASAVLEYRVDQWEQSLRSQVKKEELYVSGRFSPGYGDLPLDIQGALLDVLDAQKRLGIHINGQHLMIPQKSITAIAGIQDKPFSEGYSRCDDCAIRHTCTDREGGFCGQSRTARE